MLYLIFKHFPKTETSIVGNFCKKMRGFATKIILGKKAGKNININKCVEFSPRIKIGSNSSIGYISRVNGNVSIGSNVMIGPGLVTITRNHRFDDLDKPMLLQGYSEEKPINIGNNVWIGDRVTILPGINIPDGTIIGASSVVTHSLQKENLIIAGNPAKIIRERGK